MRREAQRPVGAALVACLCLVPVAAARNRQPTANPEEICAFRLDTIRALFEAANATGLAVTQIRAGNASAGAAPLLEAAATLKSELKRVKKRGRAHLGKREQKRLRRVVAEALRELRRTARLAKRKRASNLEPRVADAAARLGNVLYNQVIDHRALDCAPGELRVAQLHVPADETWYVPGGAVIVAADGIQVLGSLYMEGDPGDGLTLRAEQGDVVLEGAVHAGGAPLVPSARVTSPRAADADSCGDGGSVTVRAETGNIVIGSTHFLIAGNGTSCPPLAVSDVSQLRKGTGAIFLAQSGGDGGLIVLEAPGGSVRFAPRLPEDPAPFSPGSGGDGQELHFEPSFVPPPAEETDSGIVQFHAGLGGTSGSVQVRAAGVDSPGLSRVYRQGDGGGGGSLTWDQRQGDRLFPSGTDALFLGAGSGGSGVVRGGRGGDVSYQGDRTVNAVGEPVTRVAAVAGGGGDVYADPDGTVGPLEPGLLGPDDFLQGGDGGRAEATGHAGWNGDESRPDGAAGGEATALGGGSLFFGGDVTPISPNSRGGRGGDARVTSGRGGAGLGRCPGTSLPGGDGGDAGPLRAEGGGGGDAPGGQGGDGGSVLHAEAGPPGQGGEGTPPGACGALASSTSVVSGGGGEGVIMGLLGTVVEVLSNGCDPEPAPCTTTTTLSVTSTTIVCQPPPSYLYAASGKPLGEAAANGSLVSTSIDETGVPSCDGVNCRFMITARRVDRHRDPSTGQINDSIQEFSGERPSPFFLAPLETIGDQCSATGDLLFAEGFVWTQVDGVGAPYFEWQVSCAGCRCYTATKEDVPELCCAQSCLADKCEPGVAADCNNLSGACVRWNPYYFGDTCPPP